MIFVFLWLSSFMIISRSIHIPGNDIISFSFMASLYICTTSCLSIPLSMDILVASMFWLQCCSEHWGVCIIWVRFSPDICPGVGLLDCVSGYCHYGKQYEGFLTKIELFLVFKETPILFAIVAISIYIPTNSVGGFPFLHTFSSI